MGVYDDADAADPVLQRYQLRQALHNLKNVMTWKQAIDIQQERQDNKIESLDKAMVTIDKKLTSVQRTMMGVLVTLATGSAMLSLSILIGTGKIG